MMELYRFACFRYAGCDHFVFALGPWALGWRNNYLEFYKFSHLFLFTHRHVPINNH